MNWNFQEILTKDLSSAWGCDTSGNVPTCGVALRRTYRCTEFHRVKNANLRHPSAVMCYGVYEITDYAKCRSNVVYRADGLLWFNYVMLTPVPTVVRFKASVCGRSSAEILGSDPTGAWKHIFCELYRCICFIQFFLDVLNTLRRGDADLRF